MVYPLYSITGDYFLFRRSILPEVEFPRLPAAEEAMN